MKNRGYGIFRKILKRTEDTTSIFLIVVYSFLMFLPVMCPVYMFGLDSRLTWLIGVGLYLISFLPNIIWLVVTLAIWIISIPYAVHCGSKVLLVIYIICAAVYVVLGLIPSVINFISSISAWRENRRIRKYIGKRW